MEVVSLSDLARDVPRKLHDDFEAGVSRVWSVYPDDQEIYDSSSPTEMRLMTSRDDLDGGVLLPSFRLPVATLLEDLPD